MLRGRVVVVVAAGQGAGEVQIGMYGASMEGMGWDGPVWYSMVWHGMVGCGMVLYWYWCSVVGSSERTDVGFMARKETGGARVGSPSNLRSDDSQTYILLGLLCGVQLPAVRFADGNGDWEMRDAMGVGTRTRRIQDLLRTGRILRRSVVNYPNHPAGPWLFDLASVLRSGG